MIYINVLTFIVSLITTYISTPYLLKMLIAHNCLENNYRNEKVPISMGITFVLNQSIVLLPLSLILIKTRDLTFLYIILMLLIALIGLLDDLIGNKNIKGFKGHFSALLKGTLTTGGLKAIIGVLVASIAGLVISESFVEAIVNLFLIALFTNLINLLDLRPGRALKAYFIFSTFFLLTAINNNFNTIIFSSIGIAFVSFPYDIKARAMMGDIGSNTLGITLGFYCAISQTLTIKIIYLIILVFLHIVAERDSFSKIISNNKLLNYIDNLGR